MAFSRTSLKLHEILEELEYGDDEVPDAITILPPENSNADVTDEDSGDENEVRIHNLPGTQLRAQAEVHVRYESDLDSSDEEDDVPISQLAKRPRISSTSENVPLESNVQPTSRALSVSKNKVYSWKSSDIRPSFDEWVDKEGPKTSHDPMFYFDCLFDDEIIDMFVHYTNIYINSKNKLGNVTKEEMWCFFGILLYSGYVIVPRRSMYWENAGDCGMSIIYNAMSRDRFSFILSHIHCCDNNELTSTDKFAKLRPFYDLLNTRFQQYAPFEENHSIDEAMVPYYGGHPCKQFIRGKPIRWGYKFWVGATRLGYIVWFKPYQGRSSESNQNYATLGLGASVILEYADVLRLIDPKATFHLYYDNFFSSIPLFDELRLRGFKATGTIRDNRLSKCSLPPKKDFQKTARGTYKYKSTRSENILVCKWNDNSVVTVATNANKIAPITKVKRFSQQEKKYIQIDQPAVIKSYNANMGGVDRSDQNIGLYRTSIRGKKWYFSLICHGLDMMIQNAWQNYKSNGGELDHLRFRRTITMNLLDKYKKDGERKPGRTSQVLSNVPARYDHKGHLVKYQEDRLRCGYCHKGANFQCKRCVITLHPKDCFENYHTPEN